MLASTGSEGENVGEEKLKGSVTFGRTVRMAQYESVRIDLSEEFYIGEKTHAEVLTVLKAQVDEAAKAIVGAKS